MNKLFILAIIAVGAFAANCGSYTAKGGDPWGVSSAKCKLYCNMFTGFIYKSDCSVDIHQNIDYSDKAMVRHNFVYSLKKQANEKNKDEAMYDGKLTKAKARFYDYARLSDGILKPKCNPVPGSKNYDMTSITCGVAVLNRYSWVEDYKKNWHPMAIHFSDTKEGKRYMVGIGLTDSVLLGMTRSNSFEGCFPWWLTVIIIILIIGAIALIAVGVAAIFGRKKGTTKKNKK